MPQRVREKGSAPRVTAPRVTMELPDETTPGFSLFPQPILTGVLAVFWLFLVNSIDPRQVLLGLFYGWLIPLFTRLFIPIRPQIKNWGALFRFLPVFLWDVVVANVVVALIIINPFRRTRSRWLVIPLESTNPYTISTLACVITLTPGTVSSEFGPGRMTLLVHALDSGDPDEEVARIKSRYEVPIMEIFG
jgi:multicomponent K+:H+ antiporter subunit E